MTTTLANQLPRINLANGGSMQSAQVVTLKSGQQNASSVDSKSPMHALELRTSSTLPRCSRVTGNPEVIRSPVRLVPRNALVLSGPANFRVVGQPEVMARIGSAGITSGLPVTRT